MEELHCDALPKVLRQNLQVATKRQLNGRLHRLHKTLPSVRRAV
jgi:hypothetical protein